MSKESNALAGRVFRWTFADGPTAGSVYEHTFAADGTVKFNEVGGAVDAMPGSKYAAFQIAPNTYLVSYLSSHGYTLTVAMNLDSKELHGFASNDKEWYPVSGTVEVVR